MEPAGVALGAVGLLGLLGLYKEAASVVQSIKDHPSESLRLKSRYNATKVLFERWGKHVGIANDKTNNDEETVTAELKDPATAAAVADLLVSIRDIFSVVDPTLARYDKLSIGPEASNPGRTKLRSRLKWAFADGDKLENQVEDFDEFVHKLYSLVPPQKVQPDEFQKLQASLIKDQRVQALQRLTHWLDATTTENTFDAYCSTRLDKTCNWINTHPSYQGWLSDQTQINDKTFRVLWIHGPAGFGKSVLCAYLVNSLLNSGKFLVCSFFCSGDSDAQRSPSAIPRSWVYQAVYRDENVLEMALQYLDKCDSPKATHSDVLSLLKGIMSRNQNAIFVVDGLDECPRMNTARAELQRNRADILQEMLKEGVGTGARLLVVSRDEGDIKLQLRPYGPQPPGVSFSELAVTREDVSPDVAQFAEHVLAQKLPGNPQKFRQDMAAQMAEKSDGMFLLIRLQSQNLRPRQQKRQLQRALNDMPTNLPQVYERHWAEIQNLPSSDKQRAEAILRWVSFARRPLTILELSEVVAVLDPATEPDDDDGPRFNDLPDPFDREYVDSEILGPCGSFLELRASASGVSWTSSTVHLIHFSASEFLSGLHAHAPFRDMAFQEYCLAQDCLRYIDCGDTWLLRGTGDNSDGKDNHGREEKDEDEEDGGAEEGEDDDIDCGGICHRPFRQYAVHQWNEHIRACSQFQCDLRRPLMSFFSDPNPNWESWRHEFEAQQTEPHPTHPGSRTYYAACFGLLDILQDLQDHNLIEIHKFGGYHGIALHAAAFAGHVEVLKFLLEAGSNPEAEGINHCTALHTAAQGNQEDAVNLLLQHGVSGAITDQFKRTPLYCAAALGHFTITQKLLNTPADLFICAWAGWAPLAEAAYHGHLDIVKLLVENGADIDAVNDEQETALSLATTKGHIHIVEFLLDKGADHSKGTYEGVTPLLEAATKGNAEVVLALLKYGANLAASDSLGRNALRWAAREGHAIVLEILLNSGADISVSSNNGLTPLISAASRNHPEAVRILLDKGADITATNPGGWNALIYAACNGHEEIVRLLLDNRADIESTTTEGWTVLMVAAFQGKEIVVHLLLDQGADITASDKTGCTSLFLAVQHDHLATVEVLLNSRETSVHFSKDKGENFVRAVSRGHLEIAKLFLGSGANPALSDKSGTTPLAAAASKGYLEIVEMLLDSGASPTSLIPGDCEPLTFAATNGHSEIVRILIEAGASPNAFDSRGCTPLITATFRGHLEVVKVLLSLGADAGIANNEGITPQMLALQGGHSDILRVLRDHGSVVTATTMDTQLALLNSAAGDDQDMVKNLLSDGASPAATNSNGDTPLLLAVLAGNLDIVIALLDHGADPAATVQDGETALVAAASLGETDIIKAFLERGADPDTPNNLGVTPLAAAAREDHVEAARVLLEAGADALLLSSDGLQLKYSLTPFAIACGYGHDNVVQLLGDKGAYSKLSALDSLIPLHHGWRNHRDSGLERSSDKEHTVRSSQFAADDKDISEYSLKPWKYPAVMFLQTLANEAIPLAKKDFVGLEILGRILLLFNFPHLASIVFDQTMQFNTASQRATHNMRCNECYIDLSRKRYLCLDCGHVSLCGRCMMKGTTRREEKGQPFGCRGHEFFCIPSCERQPRYLDEEYSEEFVCFLQDLACSMVSIVEGKATLTNLEPSSPVNTPTG